MVRTRAALGQGLNLEASEEARNLQRRRDTHRLMREQRMVASEATPLRIVLVVLVGGNDIKYWRNGASGPATEETLPAARKQSGQETRLTMRKMHELLLKDDMRADWRFATPAEAREHAQNGEATPSKLARRMGIEDAVHDSEGRMLLSPAKVADVAAGLRDLQQEQPAKLRVLGIAVVYTDRKGRDGEPIASGPLILEYLGDQLGCDLGRRCLINAIQDDENMEGSDESGEDFPARRRVAHWVDEGLREFLASLGENARDAQPVVLATGAMAPVRDLIRASVALRCTRLPRDLSTPESSTSGAEIVESRLLRDDPVISRQEALEARGRALYLVRRGDFQGAWAAVAQFAASRRDAWWIHPLRAVARYFGGAPGGKEIRNQFGESPNAKRIADQLSKLDLHPEINDCIEEHRRFALNVAMRLEAALQGPDIEDRRAQQALFALCTLIDVLTTTRGLIAVADKEVEKLQGFFLDPRTGEVHPENKDAGQTDSVTKCGFFKEKGKSGKRFEVTSNRDAWHWLSKNEARPGFEAVAGLDRALHTRPGKSKERHPNLRTLRNSATHRALTSAEIRQIMPLGEEHGIWRLEARARGDHVLDPASEEHGWLGLVDAALRECGIDHADERYRQLVGGLEALLLEAERDEEPRSR